MASQNEKQMFSFRGILGVLLLVVIAYVLVQSRSLLALYTLATVLLSALLIIVAFDIGLKKETRTIIEQPSTAPPAATLTQPAPSRPSRKKRRR